MRIADLSIRRPILAWMIVGSFVALGWVSLGELGVDLFPRVEFPFVAITTVLEGATPDAVESEVTDVIEEHVNTISGIEALRSISSEGLSQVSIQFELEEDTDVRAQDVRDKVSLALPDLPADVELPVVEKVDPDAAPVLSVMVAGGLPIRELTRFAKDVVKERVQRVPGVGSATIVGGREREIRVWLDADRLRGYELAVDDIVRAIRAEHVETPGGNLEVESRRGEFSLKTKGEVETAAGFEDLVVAYRAGAPTLLRDVARIEDGAEDERSYAELDGVQGVSIEVRRQSGRNTVEVARAVKAVVEELQREAPPDMQIIVARDVSRFVEASARDVAIDIALGAVLAVLVTLGFLHSLRATLIVSIAIPTSIVATFFLFYVMGFTLNVLTLMALSVAIGILVDDAIVVLEVIQRRIENGEAPWSAASSGSEEVGAAVFAGTATTLAVFLPIAFMRGVVGRFFYEYGLAISFSVAFSLLVAVTLTPSVSARVLRREEGHGRVFRTLERFLAGLERAYAAALRASLRHRVLVCALTLGAIFAGIAAARGIPLEFASKVDRSEFEGIVELPQGVGIAESKAVAQRVAQAVRGVEEVARVFVTVGAGSRGAIHELSLYVEMTPKAQRSIGQIEVMELTRRAMREAAPEAKLLSVNEVAWISGGGFTAYGVEYGIQGPSLPVLEHISESVVARMRQTPLFVDAKSGYEPGKPEVQIRLDRRRAGDLGVPVRALATTVRALVGGIDIATFEEGGNRYDVRLRLEEAQRDELDEIGRIQVRATEGRLVDLANVGELQVAVGPARIEREDRSRKISVFANTSGDVALGSAADRLDEIVAEVGLPAGYRGEHAGATERMKDAADSIGFAFLMALLALYMILASQFESLTQPAVVMLSAPLSFIGAFAALRITGIPMSIFAQIGLVALMGIVMKNGILLVDCANQRRSEGLDAPTAMLIAGPLRLRPVLMTAFATIAGMVPVALSQSDGAEWRQPMGVLVIGGLLSSTFLTLLVVPVIYVIADDLRASAARALRWAASARPAWLAPPAPGAAVLPGANESRSDR